MLEDVKAAYQRWLAEQDSAERAAVESYFAEVMYASLVELQYKGASNEELGQFVRELNGFIEDVALVAAELEGYKVIFSNIQGMREPQRTLRLSRLMDSMQAEFKIPLLNSEDFNKSNPEVIGLFREISNARSL